MAGDYIITGGRPLNGTVQVPAAKNSVLPLLAASLLCSGPVRLCGVPELADVAESLALLRSAGCTAERQGMNFIPTAPIHSIGQKQRCKETDLSIPISPMQH